VSFADDGGCLLVESVVADVIDPLLIYKSSIFYGLGVFKTPKLVLESLRDSLVLL